MTLAEKLAKLSTQPHDAPPTTFRDTSDLIAEIFSALAALSKQKGWSSIKDRLWEEKLDEQWSFAVNGHLVEQTTTIMSGPQKVKQFHVYVEFNGWPAGELHPAMGGWFAAGSIANAVNFLRALLTKTGSHRVQNDDPYGDGGKK